MPLALLLAIVCLLLHSQLATDEPMASPIVAGWWAGAALIWTCGLSIHAAAAYSSRRGRWLRVHRRLVTTLAWTVGLAILVGPAQWARLVRFHLPGGTSLVLGDVALLLPVWLPLFSVAVVAVGVQRRGGSEWSDPARHRLQVQVALVLLPVLLVLALLDLADRFAPGGRLRGLTPAVVLGTVAVLFPWALRAVWRLRDADPALRRQLAALVAPARLPRLFIWNARDGHANAALVGAFPLGRFLLVTRPLLRELDAVQTGMVVRHELAHLARRHVGLRLLVLGGPWWAVFCFGGFSVDNGAVPVWSAPLVAAVYLVFALVALRRIAYLTEHDADLWACRSDRAVGLDADRVRALEGALRQLDPPRAGVRGSWLHPSTDTRAAVLREGLRCPARARQLHRRVERLGVAIVVMWLLTPAAALGLAPW